MNSCESAAKISSQADPWLSRDTARLLAPSLSTPEWFLLQQRDEAPGIAQPGIGIFGGHREQGETYLECVVREVCEEVGYFISPDRFEHLVSYNGTEVDIDGDTMRSEFFHARDIPVDRLNVTEGSLVVIEPDKLATVEHKLAPSVRLAMKALKARVPPLEREQERD